MLCRTRLVEVADDRLCQLLLYGLAIDTLMLTESAVAEYYHNSALRYVPIHKTVTLYSQ
jgi:hypothetical protein